MKTSRFNMFPVATVVALVSLSSVGVAADRTKLDNTTNLDLVGSWDALPGSGDVAVWSGAYNTAGSLSAVFTDSTPLSWGGIKIGNITGTAAGLVSIGGTGTAVTGSSLTIGTSGIDMSAANQNLVINAATIVFSGNQTWNIASGRNLRLGTSGTGAGNANVDGSGTITITGGGVVDANQGGSTGYADAAGFAGFSGKWIVETGTTLRGSRNGSTAWGSNTDADAMLLKGGTLAVGAHSTGLVGNWTWNSKMTLADGTASSIDNQIGSGTNRWLKLEGAISGQTLNTGTITFKNTNSGVMNNDEYGFILAGASTFTGGMTINSSTYVRIGGSNAGTADNTAGNNGSLAAGLAITNNGVLRLTRNDSWTLANSISGSGQLKIGGTVGTTTAQVVNLSGASNYSGATTVINGRLNLTGSLTSAITVTSGAAISGTGSTTGLLTVAGGGKIALAGGANTNSITSNGVSFSAASASLTFLTDPVSGTTYDVVTYTPGTLTNYGNLSSPEWRGTLTNTGTKITFAANGATRTWTTTTGTWDLNTTANFAEGDFKFLGGDSVVFNEPGSASVVTVSGTLKPTSVTVNNSTNAYTFSGSGVIAGSGSLAKSGAGALTLSTANTYTGGTALSAGTLVLGNASALGTGALTITGGTLDSSVANLVNSGNNAQNWNGDFAFTGSQNLNLGTGAVTMNASRQVTVSANTLTVGGVISGSGLSLTKAGNGVLTLTNANTYSGGTTLNAGTLRVGNNNALGSGTLTINGGTVSSDSGTTRTLANNLVIGSDVSFGDGTNAGQLVFDGTLDLQGSTRVLTSVLGTQGARFNGVISNGGITTQGSGRITLVNDSDTTPNTFTGATTINAGILATSLKALSSSASVTIGSSGTLAIGSNGTTVINNLSGVTGSVILSSFNIVSDGARILQINQTNNGEFAGSFTQGSSRTISLIKTGAASLTLSGGGGYTGGTTISRGTLVAANSSALGASGTVTINDANTGANNTTLNIDATGAAVTIARAINVANLGTGTVTLGSATTSGTNQAIFSGAITLAKDVTFNGGTAGDRFSTTGGISGTGNVTIAGTNRVLFVGSANTYAGATTINSNSILQLSDGTLTAASFLPDTYNVTVSGGGILKLAKGGRVESIGGLTGTGTVEAISGADTIAVGGGDATSSFGGILRDNGGSLSLTKTGTGTQTLTGTSSYTGQTSISNGTLSINSLADYGTNSSLGKGSSGTPIVIGSDTASGVLEYTGSGATTNRTIRIGRTDAGATGSGTIKNNGTGALVFSETGNFTSINANGDSNRTLTLGGSNSGANEIKGVIRDFNGATATTGVIKADGGVWVLSGTNTYTGNTSVTGGKLVINGSISTSALTTVDNGASLGGSGTVGALTVNGTLAPGNSIESIGSGNLSFGSTSTYAYELQTNLYGTTPELAGDLAYSSGTLSISNGAILTLTDLATSTALANGSKLTLISYTGLWNSGLFTYLGNPLADGATFTLGANEWKFDYNDTVEGVNYTTDSTGTYVTMTVVPEPGAALIGGLGMLVLLRRRRQA